MPLQSTLFMYSQQICKMIFFLVCLFSHIYFLHTFESTKKSRWKNRFWVKSEVTESRITWLLHFWNIFSAMMCIFSLYILQTFFSFFVRCFICLCYALLCATNLFNFIWFLFYFKETITQSSSSSNRNSGEKNRSVCILFTVDEIVLRMADPSSIMMNS